MKNVEKFLNSTQLAHLRDPSKCGGKKCELPNCVNCRCDMRSDSKFCCGPHRSAAGNIKFNINNYQLNIYMKTQRKNTAVIKNLYSRDIIRFDDQTLKIAGYIFDYEPQKIMINEKLSPLFDNIVMWRDHEGFYNLQIIK